MDVGEDVPPTILTEQVMQPKQGQPEQGEPKESGPCRDFASCKRVCQAGYRNRASHAAPQTAGGHREPAADGPRSGRLLGLDFATEYDHEGKPL